jgi:type IV secretory pathway ATPase VirB11/archaellum biosynthesis ATPase
MSEKRLYDVTASNGGYVFIESQRGWSIDDREMVLSRNEAKQLVRLLQGVLYEDRILDDSDNA